MKRVALILAAVLPCAACFNPPPAAPTELDDLTRFMFREWGHEDPIVLEDATLKLDQALDDVDYSQDLFYRSFQLDSATPEDLEQINPPPGQDPAKTVGMAVAYESRWPVTDHARLQVTGDLVPAEPSARSYVRTFLEPKDPGCFVDRSCLQIDTDNAITRSNFLLSVDMVLHKNFKWVSLPGDRWAIVSRSWNSQVFEGEDEGDAILQTYTLDVWIGRPGGKTRRYQALYQESNFGLDVEPGTVVDTVTTATDEMFETSDDYIGERFHGE